MAFAFSFCLRSRSFGEGDAACTVMSGSGQRLDRVLCCGYFHINQAARPSDSAPSHPRPLRSTVVTRFLATMSLSDFRPPHRLRLLIPGGGCRATGPATGTALPSSRRFFPRALSPFTPGDPAQFSDRSAARMLASRHSGRWPFPVLCNEAVSSSRFPTTARAFTFPSFARQPCGHPAWGRLHDFRSFIMVSTFHLTRTAKLSWRTGWTPMDTDDDPIKR